MLATKFLTFAEYDQYGDWLNSQDTETKNMYFGMAVSDDFIKHLMETIKQESEKHHFLVAYNSTGWVGTVHIATDNETAEFGIIVNSSLRKQGIGDQLIDEALTWSRNRRYKNLYMHCLSWNQAIKRLCIKHGLQVYNDKGESEVLMPLPPPSMFSIGKEAVARNRNAFYLMLRDPIRGFQEIYN